MPLLPSTSARLLPLLFLLSAACSVEAEVPLDHASEEASSGGAGSGGAGTGGQSGLPASTGGSIILEIPPPEETAASGYRIVGEEDLSDRFPAHAKLTGITKDPFNGKLYVLVADTGIFELVGDSAELVYAWGEIAAEDGKEPMGTFTDLAALGDGLFALTVPNDGYLLDLKARKMWQHFCYLPRVRSVLVEGTTSISVAYQEQGIEVWQATEGLAYELETGLLWAQPVTRRSEDDTILGSELASFASDTGTPQTWYQFVDTEFIAGAIAVTPGLFAFASGNRLGILDRANQMPSAYEFPEQLKRISGLHVEQVDDALRFLLVDETQLKLFTVEWVD